MPAHYDYAVIGAGIAGAAFAARIAPQASVLLLEAEAQPGYHSTGRSAALYTSLYGNELIRALSRASRDFLGAPPPGFTEHPLLTSRGRLYVGGEHERHIIEGIAESPLARTMSPAQARAWVPVLRPEAAAHAVLDTSAHDIDVNALHLGFLRMAKAAGAPLVCNAGVQALERGDGWRITTAAGEFRARVIVNAAGAWADTLASLAGVRPLGIAPLRRTAILIDSPDAAGSAAWPAVIAASGAFYFKPDAGLILASPCDETPSEPCDAQPEELDIAIGVDRIESVTTLAIRRVARAWAGLRSFAPDRSPVVGYDAGCDDFFWLAGLGGYGVQTAPALSTLAASLALRRAAPAIFAESGIDAAAMLPARLTAVPVSDKEQA
ncbi:NAD(P)/FAD-dependent oxidoreductase [Hydrocarboniphaga sp.]|uniref:NAD(P)/FAD-dependent oxidoreductase n=1 Tax=Hydrocarboniphaga sp. TaxID=2033016 RepID=UPI003D10ACD6